MWGQTLSSYSYWNSPLLCAPSLSGSMTSPRTAGLGGSLYVYPWLCRLVKHSEILRRKLPYKYKVFLWLSFTLCLGTDSTTHFLGLWDRLLLQRSFLPPNTYLSRNHFFCSHIQGTEIYLNFAFNVKEIIKINLNSPRPESLLSCYPKPLQIKPIACL